MNVIPKSDERGAALIIALLVMLVLIVVSAGLVTTSVVNTKISGVDFSIKAQEAYKAAGVEMIVLAPAELKRFKDKLAPVVDAWAEDLEKDKLPAKALLSDIQTLSAKYQAMSPAELMKLSIDNPVAVAR